MAIKKQFFGEAFGESVDAYVLTNNAGITVRVLNLGCIIHSLDIPDRRGLRENVVLGYRTAQEYEPQGPYFGSVIGRYANRIANGRFTIDGIDYQLPLNDGPNALHGGVRGFDKQFWQCDADQTGDGSTLEFSRLSPDGEEGFPGNLQATVTYTLTPNNELRIDYAAATDKPTQINLTQHTYFNLAGEGSGSIEAHELTIHASHITPVNATLNPTGELMPVEGTPFDFRQAKPVGRDLRRDHPQMVIGLGYDHNYVIDRAREDLYSLVPAASLRDPISGRSVNLLTTEPGVQLYTGCYLNGSDVGPSGRTYRQTDGIALETQHFPDSPNQPGFPSTLLRPGDDWQSTTIYQFAW